jgi:HAD superfamily hydrolase (TIGR01549 family)
MNNSQRQNEIIEILLDEGFMTVHELARRLHTSESSIRRDLTRLEERGLGGYFQVIAASAEIGVAKPDREIFEIALAMAGCSPDEAAMVGDRLDTDLMFGINNGFYSLTVLSGESTIVDVENNNVKPDFVLNSLNDIKNYF